MSYLAFDREAVAWLAVVVGRVADDLDVAVATDGASGDARTRARRGAAALRGWLAVLRQLGACTALDTFRPVGPDLSDLTGAVWVELAAGRAVVTDRGSGPFDGVDPDAVAAALGDALRRAGTARFDSAGERAELRRRLAVISGSGSASATFLAHLGTDGFAQLAQQLARPWRDQGWALVTGAVEPDLAVPIQLLGTILGRFRAIPTIDGRAKAEWAAAFGDLDPFLRVQLAVTGTRVPGAWGDSALRDLVERALSDVDLLPGIDTDPTGYITGSDALALLGRYPVECQRFLAEADEQIVRLALEAFDPTARQAVLLASADPRRFTPADVGPSMIRVIGLLGAGAELFDAPVGVDGSAEALPPGVNGAGVLTVPSRTFPPAMGRYLAPYVPEMFGLPALRPGGISWRPPAGGLDRTELLLLIGTYDPTALTTLATTMAAAWDAAPQPSSAAALGQAAEAIALIDQVRTSLGVETLSEQRAGLEFLAGLAQHLPVIGGVAGAVGGYVTGPALDATGFGADQAVAAGDFRRGTLAGVLTSQALTRWAAATGVPAPPVFDPPGEDAARPGADPVAALDRWLRDPDSGYETWRMALRPGQAEQVDDIVTAIRAGAGVDYVAAG